MRINGNIRNTLGSCVIKGLLSHSSSFIVVVTPVTCLCHTELVNLRVPSVLKLPRLLLPHNRSECDRETNLWARGMRFIWFIPYYIRCTTTVSVRSTVQKKKIVSVFVGWDVVVGSGRGGSMEIILRLPSIQIGRSYRVPVASGTEILVTYNGIPLVVDTTEKCH